MKAMCIRCIRTWRDCRLWCNCSAVVAPSNRHCTGSCFSVHAIDNCVGLQPNFSASVHRSRTLSLWRRVSSIFSFDQFKLCKVIRSKNIDSNHHWKNKRKMHNMQSTYVLINLVLSPRIAFRFEWAFGKQESFTVLCVTQCHRKWAPRHQTDTNFIIHFWQV